MKRYEAATTKFLLNLRGVDSVNNLPAEDSSLLDAAVNIDDTITYLREAAAQIARDMTRWAEGLHVRREVPSFPIHVSIVAYVFHAGKLDAMKGSLYSTLRRLGKVPGTMSESAHGPPGFKAWAEEVTRG